jgi:hypothetical protein
MIVPRCHCHVIANVDSTCKVFTLVGPDAMTASTNNVAFGKFCVEHFVTDSNVHKIRNGGSFDPSYMVKIHSTGWKG